MEIRLLNSSNSSEFPETKSKGVLRRTWFAGKMKKSPRLLNTKNPRTRRPGYGGFVYKVGDDLLSHTVAHAVPSAQKSLTAVFGMGTGGASPL
jgi:hypothetical protein